MPKTKHKIGKITPKCKWGKDGDLMLRDKVAYLGDGRDVHPASAAQCECGVMLRGIYVELVDQADVGREDSYLCEAMCCECFARKLLRKNRTEDDLAVQKGRVDELNLTS